MEIVLGIDWVVRTCFPSYLVVAMDLEAGNYTMDIGLGIDWTVQTFPFITCRREGFKG